MTNNLKTLRTTVAFVGLPNVGKSTLLNALVGTKIAPTTRKPQTSRRVIRGIRTLNNCQQIYFDTPGAIEKNSGLDLFLRNQIFSTLSDVAQVVAIVDAKDRSSRHEGFLHVVEKHVTESQKHFILVVNKIDQIQDKSQLLELIAHYSSEFKPDQIIPVSAMKRDGLDNLFAAIAESAEPGEYFFPEELFTDASEKEIVAELIREKAMLELEEELPYRIAVTIENFDESRRDEHKKPLVSIEAVLHVERKSQKAIVIGKGGHTLKQIGVRARKDLEHLLNCQVMLKLFVRVEANWTTSAKALRKLGY